MLFKYDKDAAVKLADTLIARYAAQTYTEEGQSCYDLIRTTSQDGDTLAQYADDALHSLCVRLRMLFENRGKLIKWSNSAKTPADIYTFKQAIAASGEAAYDADLVQYSSDVLTIAPVSGSTTTISVTPSGGTAATYTIDTSFAVDWLEFYTPDFDEDKNLAALREDMYEYLSLYVTARWLEDKYPAGMKIYADRAALALERVVSLIFSRKRVCR